MQLFEVILHCFRLARIRCLDACHRFIQSIQQIVIGEQHVHVCAVFCVFVPQAFMFFAGMKKAVMLLFFCLTLIKPGQQDGKKCHIKRQHRLTLFSIRLFDILTQTAVVCL